MADKDTQKPGDLWLEEYLATGNAKEAVRRFYPDVAEKNVAVKASHLKTRYQEEIDKRLREGYKKDAPEAVRIIKNLMTEGKQEAVKLKAAQDWLSRAGHDAALVIEDKSPKSYAELLEVARTAFASIEPDVLAQMLGKDQAMIQMLLSDNETVQ